MNGKRKRQLIATVVAICIFLVVGSAYAASRMIAWVRDLPNRISIQTDGAAGNAFGKAVIESLHMGLADSDPVMQLQTIQALADCVRQDHKSIAWVRDEFSDDLEATARSSDPNVAKAAAALMETLSQPEPNTPPV